MKLEVLMKIAFKPGRASVDREPANDGDQRRRPLTLDENEEDSGRDGPR